MITTRNTQQYDGGIQNIKDRAAQLVQALENCPLEFTLEALAIFDKFNSPGTKSRSARRWVREFSGFESSASHKKMYPIIEVLEDGRIVSDRAELIQLMKNMRDAA